MTTLYIVTVRSHTRVTRFAVHAGTRLQAIDKVMKHRPHLKGCACETVEIIEGVIQI